MLLTRSVNSLIPFIKFSDIKNSKHKLSLITSGLELDPLFPPHRYNFEAQQDLSLHCCLHNLHL